MKTKELLDAMSKVSKAINKATPKATLSKMAEASQQDKKKIYIAGKITDDKNYQKKFNKAEEKYKKKGYIVLNPAWMPQGMRAEDYMRICFSMIDTADVVVFLKDFRDSEGAKLELSYCIYTGKGVMFDA